MERERGVDLELDGGITETVLYVAVCETCGWSTQGEDKTEVIANEWTHIRSIRFGIEHIVKTKCYLTLTQVIDVTEDI